MVSLWTTAKWLYNVWQQWATRKKKQKCLNDDKLAIIEICLLNYVANKMFAQGGNNKMNKRRMN